MKSLLLSCFLILVLFACSSVKSEYPISKAEIYLVNSDSLLIITENQNQLKYTVKIDYGNHSVKEEVNVKADAFGGMEYYSIKEGVEQIQSIELWQEGVQLRKIKLSEETD